MKAMLSPSTLLSRGDPKQHANAISGLPALAITVSATKSAIELPAASIVNPNIAEGWGGGGGGEHSEKHNNP